MKLNLRQARLVTLFLVVALTAGGMGYWWGTRTAAFPKPVLDHQLDFSLFWNVWERLGATYIDKQALDPQQMVYGSIEGMVAALNDPYTVFLTPKNNDEAKQRLNGSFEGVGMELGYRDEILAVIAPLPGTPAERAGIRAGDLIIKIEGQETTSVSLPEAVELIRGPAGTAVKLTLLHQNETEFYEVSVVREKIVVPSVEISFEDNVAHLALLSFGDRTNQEWLGAVNQIVARRPKGIVLDLRNNTGGYLSGAVFVASEFLTDGVVVQQEFSDGHRENLAVDRQGKLRDYPLVVLINQGSASAAEIVAGALRDYDRATLVGETSFGKGSVQEAQELPGGAGLHITTARWLLPKGDSIDKQGIEPIVKIKDDLETETDEQWEKAKSLLS
ncbi:peptidase S41 [Candidatus Shapirobacteria bacterium CG09_land_8_20_14_0_10_49_15]|uniref:Peptidase S41 n=2 Tax=Candidatus Shapironibacteriota TaxID=1752721 RepID=A0A2M8L6R9_9BACT|nr:MAG: peptidase S41 [Candidatus Shapirobacteria bacterium CG09_land_8_20_14_0_10_49_15]PJE69888.1 MAG: peptidase S41 [Candidatus Shapirobacteria bacterium CG10_big_fil_rev_8_21_14_0_10_48_15]